MTCGICGLVVEQNARVIAQTTLGPRAPMTGSTLQSKQEAFSKTRLEDRSLGENAGELFRRKNPALEGRYRIPYSELCSVELLVT